MGDVFNANGEFAHIAGGHCHDDKFIGGGISQVVVEIAYEAYDAIAGRSGIGRGLTGRLIMSAPNRLVALGAEIPIVDLVGDISADGRAHVV